MKEIHKLTIYMAS